MLINIILVIPWSGCVQENCPLGTQAMNDLMVINVGGRSWQVCDMYDIYEVMRGGMGESKLGGKSCWELNNQVVEDIASSLHAIWLWCIAVLGAEDHWSSSFPTTSLDDRPQLWKGLDSRRRLHGNGYTVCAVSSLWPFPETYLKCDNISYNLSSLPWMGDFEIRYGLFVRWEYGWIRCF